MAISPREEFPQIYYSRRLKRSDISAFGDIYVKFETVKILSNLLLVFRHRSLDKCIEIDVSALS